MARSIRRRNRPTQSQPGLLDHLGDLLDIYLDRGNPWFSPNHPATIASKNIDWDNPDPKYWNSPEVRKKMEDWGETVGSSIGVDPSSFGGLLGTVKKVVPKNPLIVQHNIHPKALERGKRIGGIPSPSMAISKVDDPLTGFGEISLLGSPEMAIPSGKNPVYRSDGYTSRMPHIEIVPDKKSQEIVKKFYAKDKIYSPEVKSIFTEIYTRDYNKLDSDLLKTAFLKSKGVTVPKLKFKKTDTWEQQQDKRHDHYFLLRDLMKPFENSGQILPWLKRQQKRIEKAGGNFSERVYRGRSDITGSKRWSDATVENIVREMKKGPATESPHSLTSMGEIRAQVSPKFKSLAEIKKSRDKVVSREEFDNIRSEMGHDIDDVKTDIYDVVQKHYGDAKYDGWVANSLIEDIFVSTPRKSDYPEGLVDAIKPETIEKARILRQKMANMPTEYFEIKPRRGVDLSEFKGAIIPKDVYSKDTKKILKNSGVKKIMEYGSHEERKQLFKKFPELMFGLLPPAIIGGLLSEQEM